MENFYIPLQQANKFKNIWVAIYFKMTDEFGKSLELRRKVKLLSLDEQLKTIQFSDDQNRVFTWPLTYIEKISVIR